MVKTVSFIVLFILAPIVAGLHATSYNVPLKQDDVSFSNVTKSENVPFSNITVPKENVTFSNTTKSGDVSTEAGKISEDEKKFLDSVTPISKNAISTKVKHKIKANKSEPCTSYPNRKIILVQINEEYLLTGMFANFLYYARPFLGEDTQLVVDADDARLHKKILEVANLTNSPIIINRLMERKTAQEILNEEEYKRLSIDEKITDAKIMRNSRREPYGSTAFGALMSRRPHIIGSFLKEGCPLLLADVDTIWQADVFADIEAAGYHDLYVTDNSCSNVGTSGKEWRFCGCFLYLRPHLGEGDFVDAWYARTQQAKDNEQRGLNQILQARRGTDKEIDFAVLPFSRFPPGCKTRTYSNRAHVIHANYVLGIEAKMQFFRKIGRWQGA